MKYSNPRHPHYHEYMKSLVEPPPPPASSRSSRNSSHSSNQSHQQQHQRAQDSTSAHRKYGMVTLRSAAATMNSEALSSFKNRLHSCIDKFDKAALEGRSALYDKVERETVQAIERMRREVAVIEKEVSAKFKEEDRLHKEEVEKKAMRLMEDQFAAKLRELEDAIEAEGPDVVARQRAHEALHTEIRRLETEISEAHRKALEDGALARLNERETSLAQQRAELLEELEEKQRSSIADLSKKLSADASAQISSYRIELENLRESRITSARLKERDQTEAMVQELKHTFIKQAEEEISTVDRGSDDDLNYALKQVRDEVSRFQALKATEITTNARSKRAQTLPAMAMELEERAEGIERSFRIGLMGEDSREEREIVERASEELAEHVYGARDAVLDDNETFVREITDEFMKARSRVLRARAEYLKVPIPSAGGGLDESGLLDGDGSSVDKTPNTSAPPANVRTLVSQFEQLRARHLATGAKVADAQMEKLLLQYEIKAARVRRAELNRSGGGHKHSRRSKTGRSPRKCLTCKPLTEANLELQRVATRMRAERSREERGEHSSRSHQPRLSVELIKSRYGGGMGGEGGGGREDVRSGRASPGAESVSSTASSREAEFVKRFLGKVTKSSGTLRGTLAMLNGSAQGEHQHQHQHPHHHQQDQQHHQSFYKQPQHQQRAEAPTAFDDLISQTLGSSVIDSHQSNHEKRQLDDRLVKSLLDVSLTESDARMGSRGTPVLLSRGIGGGDSSFASIGGGAGDRNRNRSFETTPAVMAPALSIESVNEFVEDMSSTSFARRDGAGTARAEDDSFEVMDSEADDEEEI
jgi:hypothetical protein